MSEDPCRLRSNYSFQRRWESPISDFSLQFYLEGSRRGNIGDALLHIDSEKKCIQWDEFYPLIQHPDLKHQGYGTQAMVLCLEILVKNVECIAKFTVTHSSPISTDRRKQLRKMNIDPAQSLVFSEYQKRVQDYCGKLQKKYDRELQSSQ